MTQRVRVSAIIDIDMQTPGGSVTRAVTQLQTLLDGVQFESPSNDLEFTTYVVGFGPDPRMIDCR